MFFFSVLSLEYTAYLLSLVTIQDPLVSGLNWDVVISNLPAIETYPVSTPLSEAVSGEACSSRLTIRLFISIRLSSIQFNRNGHSEDFLCLVRSRQVWLCSMCCHRFRWRLVGGLRQNRDYRSFELILVHTSAVQKAGSMLDHVVTGVSPQPPTADVTLVYNTATVLNQLLFFQFATPFADEKSPFGVKFHGYADDTQLYLAANKNSCTKTAFDTVCCTNRVDESLIHYSLPFNPDKSKTTLLATSKRVDSSKN